MSITEIGLAGRVVITKHADARLHERFGESDLDVVRDEISDAIHDRHYTHRAHNFFYVFAGDRCYPVACARGRVIVMTVQRAA